MGSRVLLQLLAAGGEVYTTVSRHVERRCVRVWTPETFPPIERASFIAANRDNDAGRLDAAAGCEFVDDRIRLRE
jgi:hypothetical protein